jgi:hypothetical protein
MKDDANEWDYTTYENDPRTREEKLDDILEESIGGVVSILADEMGLDGLVESMNLDFVEHTIVGLIDGMTAFFANECRGGL